MHRLHRKAACAFLVVTAAAAMILAIGAASIDFDISADGNTDRNAFYPTLYQAAGQPAASVVSPPRGAAHHTPGVQATTKTVPTSGQSSATSTIRSTAPDALLEVKSGDGWTGDAKLDFPLSAVDTVTEELVISLNQRILQENQPKTAAAYGLSIDGDQKHLTNYGGTIYDCYNTETILFNSKNDVAAGTALTGQQSYYGYALQVSEIAKQDRWHRLAESTGKDPWQCTWWAWGRAAQYLHLVHGQSLTVLCDGITNMGHGGAYYRNLSNYFVSSETTPKANSIVSWSGGEYGHVGYVEAVDENGIWVSMADAGHAWRGITYIPRGNDPDNPYPLYWYGNEHCNGFNYLDDPI